MQICILEIKLLIKKNETSMALIIMSWKMNIKLPKISLLKAVRNDQTFYVIKLI